MILLVVDTQKGCFNENLYLFETIKKNIKQLISLARENNVEVVYVQHDDGPGTDLDKSADNYEIYEEFAPRDGEKRFEKNVNSAFHPMTGLTEYLQSKGEKDIIAIGVSTDYCMDATVKSGFEKGFNIIIPEYTNSTYDNPYFDKEAAYHYFNDFMWNKRYAKVISFEQATELLQSKDNKKNTTQEERLDYLVEEFKADSDEYKELQTPNSTEDKRRILRSLMNIRMPKELSSEVMKVQDEYLTERAAEKGVVNLSDIPVIRDGLSIWQGDITRLSVDAIVNAANSQMLGCFVPMHTCIDNCIHTFAGVQLRAECNRQMNELRIRYGRDYEQPTAVPMLTEAYNLPAKKVIHIVGPIVQYKLTSELEKDLENCYRNTLDMCAENGLKSVAFCCISTGVFHFPNKKAAEIAVKTVSEWLRDNPGKVERVIFNVFKDEDKAIYEKLI